MSNEMTFKQLKHPQPWG